MAEAIAEAYLSAIAQQAKVANKYTYLDAVEASKQVQHVEKQKLQTASQVLAIEKRLADAKEKLQLEVAELDKASKHLQEIANELGTQPGDFSDREPAASQGTVLLPVQLGQEKMGKDLCDKISESTEGLGSPLGAGPREAQARRVAVVGQRRSV